MIGIKRNLRAPCYKSGPTSTAAEETMADNMFRQDPADALEWRSLGSETGEKPPDALRAFRDITAVVSHLSGDTLAVEVAASLARRARGRLDVVQVLAMPVTAADAWALIPDPARVERHARLRREAAERAGEFSRMLAGRDVQGEVRTLEALHHAPGTVAAASARHADLVVMGRPTGSASQARAAHRYFAALLLESGRPVLVVPEGTTASFPPGAISVAWAETAEAARALHDAMPLLEGAETVDIVIVDVTSNESDPLLASAANVMAHLRAHGARTHLVTCSSRGSSVGHTLLRQATRRHAQLLVAGGYGHGRLREWALGGTTRELFIESPIPVLFSH
ncbi:universal stress protein [Luteibacter sp. UNCMF331Sha3.1]|uniref:universal stress protein n=1 Tax=Luteibacter sp. UNCMF331Sha3.1 TaxID=1502760 RepID=UPI0011143BAD|nr:universal stress protein [Luteibacter sp. UNCMF331Sha3.1]